MVHNVDALGADVDPDVLGWVIEQGATFTAEVITRCLEDRGGGLACVDGRLRLLEGLAMPHEEDEFGLSYYNSNTSWLHIDRLLAVFGLARADLIDAEKVAQAVRAIAADADLRDPQGCQEAVGPWAGGYLPWRSSRSCGAT